MTSFGVTDDGSLRYAESEAKEVKLTPYQWTRGSSLKDGYFTRFRNQDGVSSLGDMAMRSVIRFRHGLTSDVLAEVPWEPIGKRIWEGVKAKKGTTVAVWREFATAYAPYPEAEDTIEVVAPIILPMDLLPVTMPLIDGSLQFVTLLNVVNQPMDLSRWMSFCDLRNLRTLLVDTGRMPTNFDERVAKGWSLHAVENGTFQNLYAFILCAYNERRIITAQSMDYLLDLPNLHIVGLRGVHLPRAVDQSTLGWKQQRSDAQKYAQLTMEMTDTACRSSQIAEDMTKLSTASSLARLHKQFWKEWPSPTLRDSVSKLVVRVGDAGDVNIFRVSYNLFSSFNVMVRNVVDVKEWRKRRADLVSTPPTPQPRSQPRMRAKAQRDFGSMLSSFGG